MMMDLCKIFSPCFSNEGESITRSKREDHPHHHVAIIRMVSANQGVW